MGKISKSITTITLMLLVSIIFFEIAFTNGKGLAGAFIRNVKSPLAPIEESLNSNLPFRNLFLDGYSELLKVERRIEYTDSKGTIVRGQDGQLFVIEKEVPQEELQKEAGNVNELAGYCIQRSVPFYYIQVPWKTSSDTENVPVGAGDFTDLNANYFILCLNSDDICIVDLRKNYQGGDFHYVTDHHWKTETCFDAVQVIERDLEKKFPSLRNENASDKSRYLFETKHKVFLGSIGRRIGEPYSGLDDFTYIYPKFETNLHYQHIKDNTVEIDKSGTFKDVMFSDPEESDYYCSVLNNSYCEMRVENFDAENNLKCLLISDSYGRPFTAYMSLYFKNFINIDTQSGRFRKDIYEFIDNEKPDIVIMMFNSGMLGTNEVFDFHEKGN